MVELPSYAPELDPIESVWADLRGTRLAHRLFSGYDDIVDACRDARNSFTADSKTLRSINTRRWAVCQKL